MESNTNANVLTANDAVNSMANTQMANDALNANANANTTNTVSSNANTNVMIAANGDTVNGNGNVSFSGETGEETGEETENIDEEKNKNLKNIAYGLIGVGVVFSLVSIFVWYASSIGGTNMILTTIVVLSFGLATSIGNSIGDTPLTVISFALTAVSLLSLIALPKGGQDPDNLEFNNVGSNKAFQN